MSVRLIFLLSVLGLLSGCIFDFGGSASKHGSSREPEATHRDVVAGDTLYSIAWEAGQDYRELAAWNRIPPPYTIHPGQRIRLNPPADSEAEKEKPQAAPAPVRVHVVRRGDTLYGIARQHGVMTNQLALWNRLRKPYRIHPGQKLVLAAPAGETAVARKTDRRPATGTKTGQTTPRRPPPKPAPARPEPERDPAPVNIGSWTWPTRGTVIEHFSAASARKGIDFSGQRGQPIVAAAGGSVVYRGSGLRGYGQLIIIKHNADFLSAYAHCQQIVVKEGEIVKRGQKIAEMGSTGTDRIKLHFEIRHRGKPVNPLRHLPGKP